MLFRSGRWQPVFGRLYAVADYADFASMMRACLRDAARQGHQDVAFAKACFGVAGPAFDNRVRMTNLGWVIDAAQVSADFGIPEVRVVNDFAAAAHGVGLLQESDLVTLQQGVPLPHAPRLVLGAGSGLGIAYLAFDGVGYQVIPGEGGHAGFAPSNEEQMDLWRTLHQSLGRVSAEHVVSGPGLLRLYQFNLRSGRGGATASSAISTPAEVSKAALDGTDTACSRALDLFTACYGAVAGDHALAIMARGGVYIAGGIAAKILPRLLDGGFMAAFNDKGGHADPVRQCPVSVVVNHRLGLLGCAALADTAPSAGD